MATAEVQFRLGEYLEVAASDGEPRFRCAKCGHDLGPASGNYKEHALRRVAPLEEAGPLVGDPSRFIDDRMEIRQFFCPGCVTQLDTEINRAGEPIIWDIELH
ncbi:MAG: acetophenone carboxylase [Microbispora sp.]|nr:acetophenone carboxylase [Microbispora sp.]